jgi:tRNA threonylcarbamoyladenosine biosynthesis protein TsaB
MREVYYAALEKRGARWHEVVPVQCVAPRDAALPPGEGWVGCGNGFAAYRDVFEGKVSTLRPQIHPGALAVAQLAAPRLAAGEGVEAGQAAPLYIREKVAFTQAELEKNR